MKQAHFSLKVFYTLCPPLCLIRGLLIRFKNLFLLIPFLVMSWQTQAQTQSQEESVTGDLILTVNIEQLNNITGLYHVSFDFGGTPPDDASSCVGEVSLDMRFEFYSGTPTNPSTLLYTYDLTKTNGENIYFIGDSNDKDNFWHTDNLINDYVVYVPPSEDSEGNPCNANGLTNIEMSQIQFVKVVSSFHVGECWDTGIGNVSYSVNYEGDYYIL